MEPKGDVLHLEFGIPVEELSVWETISLTATPRRSCYCSQIQIYEPWKGIFLLVSMELLLSMDKGKSTAYSIDKLQDRGRFFVELGRKSMPVRWLRKHSSGWLKWSMWQEQNSLQTCASGSDEKCSYHQRSISHWKKQWNTSRKTNTLEVTPKASACEKYCWMKMSEKELQKLINNAFLSKKISQYCDSKITSNTFYPHTQMNKFRTLSYILLGFRWLVVMDLAKWRRISTRSNTK